MRGNMTTVKEEKKVRHTWQGPLSVAVDDAVITAYDARYGETEYQYQLDGRGLLPRATPQLQPGGRGIDRWTYVLLADEALFLLANEVQAEQDFVEVDLRGDVRLFSALVEPDDHLAADHREDQQDWPRLNFPRTFWETRESGS